MAKKPDYKLFAKKKDAKHGVQIGAGWSNDWGGVSIKLNPCVYLTDRDDIYLTLYPAREQQEPLPKEPTGWEPPILDDDNVPF